MYPEKKNKEFNNVKGPKPTYGYKAGQRYIPSLSKCATF
jgi:hypothetical protein